MELGYLRKRPQWILSDQRVQLEHISVDLQKSSGSVEATHGWRAKFRSARHGIPSNGCPVLPGTNKMEALGRVELPTNGLGNRCSIHLSYRATRRNRLDYFSLPQQTLGECQILLPNCCPIAGWRFRSSPSLPVHRRMRS